LGKALFQSIHTHADRLLEMARFVILGLAGIAVMAGVQYGWGRVARRLAGLPGGTWPVTCALGMASLLFVGGLLNLLRLAYPAALAVLAAGGLAVAAGASWRERAWCNRPGLGALAWGVLILGLTCLVCATQLEPRHYNRSDDFGNFFAHVLRMVQTGTLYGSPLNALGAEVFGGQAFLQGFVAGFFPLSYINAFDAVFCFFLCLALVGSVAFARERLWPAAAAATLAIAIIDPLYVNVSSLYSTAALVSALAISSVDPRERGEGTGWRSAMVPALLYAGAIALKLTCVTFVGLHWSVTAVATWRLTGSWRSALLKAGSTAALTTLFLAPWILLYAPYYWTALTHPLASTGILVPELSRAEKTEGLMFLFSPTEQFYGGPVLAYTAIAAGLILCALAAFRNKSGDVQAQVSRAALAAIAAAAAMTYLFWVVYGPLLQELAATLRYAVPFLIGACSAALPLFAMLRERRDAAICAACLALLLALYANSARQRLDMLARNGSQLAFLHHWSDVAISSDYHFQQWALNGQGQVRVRQMQEAVPPGETILAWSGLSFLLDFRRNRVLDMNVAGMGQRWSRIPAAPFALIQFAPPVVPTDNQLYAGIYKMKRRVGQLDARALEVKRYFQGVPESSLVTRKDEMELIRLDEKGLELPE